MNVLYIESDHNIRDLYVMKLEADFRAQVTEAKSEAEAITLLKEDSDFQMILIDLDMMEGGLLYKYVRDSGLDIPFIVITGRDLREAKGLENFREDHRGNRLITKPVNEKVFKTVIIDAFGACQVNVVEAQKRTESYTPVKIYNFMRFNSLPCEAFIRLSEEKYLKLINANDMYSSEIIDKYIKKNVQVLYVRENDYPILADTGIRTLLDLYERKPKGEDLQDLQLMAIEDIHHKVREFNDDPEVVALAKKTVESSITMIKRYKNISHLLQTMKKNADYIYDHSLRVSYISIAIAKHTEWSSDNTCFKLSLAAMMHDMTLPHQRLARIERLNDPTLQKFSKEEIETVQNHPNEAAALIRENKQLPADIDFIVAQHHELPDGSGFPRGLSRLRISPLACVFILAHEFFHIMERLGGEYSRNNLAVAFEELNEKGFSMGNFKRPYQGLLAAFALGV